MKKDKKGWRERERERERENGDVKCVSKPITKAMKRRESKMCGKS